MNDENLELLSAYLDGALPEAERKALEGRIAASADLRRELDELREVSRAVKELPKEPLPAGFMARFQARRVRGDAPRPDWVMIPPMLRPVMVAASFAVVALVIWDKVAVPPEPEALHPPVAANVVDAKNAPVAQLDFSGRVTDAKRAEMPAAAAARSALGVDGVVPEPVRRGDTAPYLAETASGGSAPADALEKEASAPLRPAKAGARASGSPIAADSLSAARGAAAPAERGALAMTEEERSARNERMFADLERQKRKMGIAKVMPKQDALVSAIQSLAAPAAPAAPKVASASPGLLNRAPASMPAAEEDKPAASPGPGRLAPDAGLVFTDARSLSSSWVLLGFPGEPPAVDFASGRVVLIKPSATKILSVDAAPNSINVVYRSLAPEETPDPAADRVAPIPSEPRTVLIFDASPR